MLATAGCAFDGPTADVRVVGAANDAPAGGDERVDEDATSSPDGGPDPGGVPGETGDAPGPGLEDRPAALGAIDMPTTVAVVGDSLTVAATEEITQSLTTAGVRVVVVDAQQNRRMVTGGPGLRSGVSAIEDVLAEHDPDLWVVALGTNDVGSGSGPDRFVDDLRETIATIPATAPLVWVDVWIRDRVDEVVEANGLLRRELGRRPATTRVVDWHSWGTVDGTIVGDGVHLTTDGEQRFAGAITDAVIAVAVEDG